MKIIKTAADWKFFRASANTPVGFVPTMGALHSGHASLIRRSTSENKTTIASIFINPTQFNNKEDFEKYPTSLDADLDLLEKLNCDYLFLPNYNEIYSDNYRFKLSENSKSKLLCGAHRPGHFDGVLTVVMKLLNIIEPDTCYMGEKDYQQFLLIEEMSKAFFLKSRIVPCETVREADGLAMSSRNLRLTPTGREKAGVINKLLKSDKTLEQIKLELVHLGFYVDYVEEHWGRRFVAATIDNVRLIDNVKI